MSDRKNLRWQDVRVGIFIFVGMAFMFFIILVVGTNTRKFTSKYTLHTFVPNVISLNPGAYITIAGIKAGTIGDFEYTTREGKFGVHISLFVEHRFKKWVTTSSKATIKTLGMLGDKYVEISLGLANEKALEDNDYIPANPPFDFESLLPKAEQAANTIPLVLTSIESLLQKLQSGPGTMAMMLNDSVTAQSFNSSLANLAALTASMNNKQGSFGKLIHSSSLYDNLDRLTKNLDQILRKIDKGEGTIGKLVADSTLYKNLQNATANTDSIMRKINAGQGTAGKLINEDAAHKNLEGILKELNLILQDMQKYPQKYFQVKVF
ncbi:MAG: MCE family protein [Calditrichaeota bacterium]|nr:MAG: MCE family protein [Calditrichota bacterium]